MNRRFFKNSKGIMNMLTMLAVIIIGLYILVHSVKIIDIESIEIGRASCRERV